MVVGTFMSDGYMRSRMRLKYEFVTFLKNRCKRSVYYLAPRPKDWLEIPYAPVRRLVQRVAHWRGMHSGEFFNTEAQRH